MKKKLLFLITCLFFTHILVVSAEGTCSYKEKAELSKEISSVKVEYEGVKTLMDSTTEQPVSGDELNPNLGPEEGYYYVHSIRILIVNMPENVWVEVTNDYNNESKEFEYSDSQDGVITINHDGDMVTSVTNYTFNFYALSDTDCDGELIKTIVIKVPRYNYSRELPICRDNEKLETCKEYVTWEDEGQSAFIERAERELDSLTKKGEKKTKKKENKAIAFVEENKNRIIVILGAVIVVGSAVIILKKIKKRGKSPL